MLKYLYSFLLVIFLLPMSLAYGNDITISPDSHSLRIAPNTAHRIEFSTWPEAAEGHTSFGYMSGARDHILNIPPLQAGTRTDIVVTFTYLHIDDWTEYTGYVIINLTVDASTPPTSASLSVSSIAQGGSATLSASGGTGSNNFTFATSGTWPQGVTISGTQLNISNNAEIGSHNVSLSVTREGANAVILPISFTVTERAGASNNQNNEQNQGNQSNNDNRQPWATDFTPEGGNLPPWALQPGQQTTPPVSGQTEQPNNDPSLVNNNANNQDDVTPPWVTGGQAATGAASFADVSSNQWYYEYVMDVSGFFHGAEGQFFNPQTNMTRAMFVYTLANLHDVNTEGLVANFNDVPSSSWYAGAVAWANNSGIVQGVGEGQFAPNSNITREQIAVMFANYIDFAGVNLVTAGSPTFTDASSIASWATDAVELLSGARIVGGRPDGTFDPQASVTRAETAAMFSRFVLNIGVVGDNQPSGGTVQQASQETQQEQQNQNEQLDFDPSQPQNQQDGSNNINNQASNQATNNINFTSYQQILDYYTARLNEAIPIITSDFRRLAEQNTAGLDGLIDLNLAHIERLAAISLDGTAEMAEFMLRTNGDMATYMEYASRLNEVYMQLGTQISDIFMEFSMRLMGF